MKRLGACAVFNWRGRPGRRLCRRRCSSHAREQIGGLQGNVLGRAIWCADGVVRSGDGPLGFVPDSLMDDPPETKRRLLSAYDRLLGALDFDHVLLAHGGPVIGDGRAQLQDLIDSGGRTAFTF